MFQQKHGTYAESLKRTFPGVSTFSKTESVVFLFLSGKNESFVSVAKSTKGFLQTNKQANNRTYEHSGIPIFRTSKGNEIWFEKLEVPKLEGLL